MPNGSHDFGVIDFFSSLVFPWLLVCWLGLRVAPECSNRRLRAGMALLWGGLAAGLVVLPVLGLPAGRWFHGLNFQASVPLTGLLVAGVWRQATGQHWLRESESRQVWSAAAVAALLLYPSALGLGHVDLYEWGWGAGPLLFLTAASAIALALAGNRTGWLLIATLLAFAAQCFEAANLWDYLLDPVFAFLGLCVSLVNLVKGWRLRRRAARSPAPPTQNTPRKAVA